MVRCGSLGFAVVGFRCARASGWCVGRWVSLRSDIGRPATIRTSGGRSPLGRSTPTRAPARPIHAVRPMSELRCGDPARLPRSVVARCPGSAPRAGLRFSAGTADVIVTNGEGRHAAPCPPPRPSHRQWLHRGEAAVQLVDVDGGAEHVAEQFAVHHLGDRAGADYLPVA